MFISAVGWKKTYVQPEATISSFCISTARVAWNARIN